MVMHRDRWPAVLTREQEDILMSAGFHYDPDLGVLVDPELRKPPSGESATFDPSRATRSARGAEIVFDGEAAREFRDSVKETLPLGVGAI